MATTNTSGAAAADTTAAWPAETLAQLHADAEQVIARYPQRRSALLPLLHLVQSVDGYVSGRGIEFCAQVLDLTTAEVSGVATFYTQYKRHPNGDYTVGVCTNTLCAVMGGDQIWESVSDHLGIGHDETTADGRITLERIECNAACDYAPVVMANWEFFDNQTPESTNQLVDDLRSGVPVVPTRGAGRVCDFRQVSRVLAGFSDGRADEGAGAGSASLEGLRLARQRGWTAPGTDEGQDGATADAAGAGTDTSARAADTGGLEPGRHSSTDTPANDPDETPAGGEDKA
jgi:NADH-quinone oxidoreductase subunit E